MYKFTFADKAKLDSPENRPRVTAILNSVQEELCALVETARLVPDGSEGQLLSAVKRLLYADKPSDEVILDYHDRTYNLFDYFKLDSSQYRAVYFELENVLYERGSRVVQITVPFFLTYSNQLECWQVSSEEYFTSGTILHGANAHKDALPTGFFTHTTGLFYLRQGDRDEGDVEYMAFKICNFTPIC